MKELLLYSRKKRKVVLVDDEDYEYLAQFRWIAYKGGSGLYAKRCVLRTDRLFGPDSNIYANYKMVLMHREIVERFLGRKLKRNELIDHKNRNGWDNQKCNLRVCTHQQNCWNSKWGNGSSKFNGVSLVKSKSNGIRYHRNRKKWLVRIKKDNKSIFVGLFSNEVEAARAYDGKAKELFGEFAHLNFPKVSL